MKKIIILYLSLVSYTISYADTITLKNRSQISGKIIQITDKELKYIPENSQTISSIERSNIQKIEYDNGKKINFEPENKTILVHNDTTPGLVFPFPLRFSYNYHTSETDIYIYNEDKEEIASGNADFREHSFEISYEPVETSFYITPELGFFYRKIEVKDYSYSVDTYNNDIEGFIPGTVTSASTGETIEKDNISSLSYKAKYYSYYIDLKTGYNLVFNFFFDSNIILNPYISVNLLEYRKTVYQFSLNNQDEEFKLDYKFTFLSSYGIGCELGLYFPELRCGLLIGYDRRYIRKFELPEDIKFKEVYQDENLNILRTREQSADYSSIIANLITIKLFCYF